MTVNAFKNFVTSLDVSFFSRLFRFLLLPPWLVLFSSLVTLLTKRLHDHCWIVISLHWFQCWEKLSTLPSFSRRLSGNTTVVVGIKSRVLLDIMLFGRSILCWSWFVVFFLSYKGVHQYRWLLSPNFRFSSHVCFYNF